MRTVDIFSLDDQEWARFFEIRKALHAKYYSKVSSRLLKMNLAEFRKMSLSSVETLCAREYIFFQDGNPTEPFGWMRCFSGNDDLVFQQDALVDVLPREMVTKVAELLLKYMDERPVRQVITSCKDNRLVRAVRNMQPQSEAALLIMKLSKGKLNAELAREWAAHTSQYEGELRFRFERDLPEDLIEEYVVLHDSLLRDMPMTDGPVQYNSWSGDGIRRLIQFNKENKQSSCYFFVLNNKNEMVGLSEIVVRHSTMRIAQGMTGLLPPYRGKGLAKVLKGLMLAYVIEAFPDFEPILTTTSPLNTTMQHINTQLGFEVEGKMYEYIFQRENLEKLVPKPVRE